jgi:hypothetical protein
MAKKFGDRLSQSLVEGLRQESPDEEDARFVERCRHLDDEDLLLAPMEDDGEDEEPAQVPSTEPIPFSIKDAEGHEHGESDGRFVGDGEGGTKKPKSSAGKAVDAATQTYHYLHDKGSAGFKMLPTPVQKAVSTALAVAFAGWTASQKVAERISIEKGSTPEEAAKLRSVLASWDIVAFKPVAVATAPLGGIVAAASWVIPPVTGAYLAHSAVRHPMATYRAAKGLVSDAIGAARQAVEEHTQKLSLGEI